jgi:hypothetical protein
VILNLLLVAFDKERGRVPSSPLNAGKFEFPTAGEELTENCNRKDQEQVNEEKLLAVSG